MGKRGENRRHPGGVTPPPYAQETPSERRLQFFPSRDEALVALAEGRLIFQSS